MFPPVAIARAGGGEGEETHARRRSDRRCEQGRRELLPSAEERHAARHDTEDDTPAGRAVVCRRVDANARAAARAHIVALALVRIGDARGAVLRRTRIADTFREQESCGVGRAFSACPESRS